MNTEPRDVAVRSRCALGESAQWALDQFKATLAACGWRDADQAAHRVTIDIEDRTPESFTIRRMGDQHVAVIGADDRGLVYALTELADTIENGHTDDNPFAQVTDVDSAPDLAWRSVQVFVAHATLDAAWYFDDAYWSWYLSMLARWRFNNLSLTFCHQTAYLAPPYPFHVELAEFPQVRTPGFDAAQRSRHLGQLRFVSDLAKQRGLHFTLGVWQQHDNGFGTPMVEGLDEDVRADCNALGLKRMLEACPAIDGLQLRMNYEAGIPEDQQALYWQKQFDAVASVGRPIRVDLRAKGLADETIALAKRALDHVVVSTKYWCEHLGMPYHMTAIQQFDVPHYRRYGPWDLLRKPLEHDLIFRLWTFGTQRVLQWGDSEYVRRFAHSCHEVAGGFEVMAPLTNKGSRNEPVEQPWRIINDRSVQPFEWEQQRYERFYRLFGRIGYDASYCASTTSLDAAFDAAGMIMPLITTVLQYSASAWGYWPELFAGRSFIEDVRIEPSDPVQFYGVDTYVTDALRDTLDGRWTPHQIAHHLHTLASATHAAIDRLKATSPVTRGAILDLQIQADLAQFHAYRLVAMTHWQVFEMTRIAPRLDLAIDQMGRALDCWHQLTKRTAGVYHDHLTFGRKDFGHIGHWKDRVAHVQAELDQLHKRWALKPSVDVEDRTLPGEQPYPEMGDVDAQFPLETNAGKSFEIILCLEESPRVTKVVCHHKPALQTLPFKRANLCRRGNAFVTTLVASDVLAQWDLLVFFEIHFENGSALRHPDWRTQTPYYVIRTR